MKNIQRKDILKMSKDYNKKGIKKVESYKKKTKENIFRNPGLKKRTCCLFPLAGKSSKC